MRCRVYNPPSPFPLSAGMSDGKIHLIKKKSITNAKKKTHESTIYTHGWLLC